MIRTRFFRLAAAPVLAIAALSGCTTGFDAKVARFQQMPAPQEQSFTVVAEDSSNTGALEFQYYADIVAARLAGFGYRRAVDPAEAQLVVRLGYQVGPAREKIVSTGFAGDPFFNGGWGWGWGRGWGGGFYDPFLWGGGFGGRGFGFGGADIRSYTVFNSVLNLRIDRAGSGQSVFDGTARAQSSSDKQTYLVPSLIEALFTGFPGNNGEEIRVKVPAEPKK